MYTKKEVLNYDPYIVMFHDVISDKEADELKNTAMPKVSIEYVAVNLLNIINYREVMKMH